MDSFVIWLFVALATVIFGGGVLFGLCLNKISPGPGQVPERLPRGALPQGSE